MSSVLRIIHTEERVSRARLAKLTGLNKSTVSSLAEQLLERKLIVETGLDSIGTGRPSTILEINPQAGGIIGIELGVDFVAVALTDFKGKVLWHQMVSADPNAAPEATLSQTKSLLGQALQTCQNMGIPTLGIGLATPGTVDLENGVLIFAPNLHWHNIPLRDVFSDFSGMNVIIENDANAAAIGEHLFGEARQCTDFIFVFAGVGIGSGLFLDNHLYRGKNGFAGEIGHSPILSERIQSPCHCGNRGCWETYANQYSIIQRIQARLEVRRPSIIPDLMARNAAPLSIGLIKEAADLGDKEALDAFAEAGVAMGHGFATLINFFNPEMIVLGGPMSLAGEYLIPGIRESVKAHTLPEIEERAAICFSRFGEDASLIGATAIVVDSIFSTPANMERR